MTDQEATAIAALQEGDIQGLEQLVRLYQSQATRLAFQITANRHIAEDVVADAFITAFDRIAQYHTNRPFQPWFYRIVVNNSLKAVARGRRIGAAGEIELDQRASVSASPEDEAVRQEERDLVIEAIQRLPAKQRATLVLRYYLDMDVPMIAETLGVPRGTVKWRLYAARSKLRTSLNGESPETHAHTGGVAR
jgi:RNA polymerase sigma-70 factor (ECF subfamily)